MLQLLTTHFLLIILFGSIEPAQIAVTVPPYHFWAPPPDAGHLPMHGSDFGLFQLAEVLGMKQLIFVKDEDGLYDRDPKKGPGAKKYDKLTLDQLLANPPPANIVDEELFRAWAPPKNLRAVVFG